MVKYCLALLGGGLAAQHSTTLPASDALIVALVASICAVAWRPLRLVAIASLGFVLFMLAATRVVDARLDERYAGDSMLAAVRVISHATVSGASASFLVESAGDARIPRRVRVRWFEPRILPLPGEVWELELRLARPRGHLNPGVFDYETWLFREKIHATGYVVPGRRNRLLWSGTASPLDRFRDRFAARARAAAETDAAAAVLIAIATGARYGLSREQWDDFAATGTSHLMAISGLHVGLAASFGFLVALAASGILRLPGNRIVAALGFAALAAAAYAMVSGLGVPARRAVVMLAAGAATVGLRRQPDAPAIVSLAAIIVFATDPIATLTPGFHLSFAAVVLLVWLARRREPATAVPRWLRWGRDLAVLQVFLLFGLAPLTAIVFQRFVPVATPVNLVAVPLFSVVTVPLTLAGLALGDLSETAALFCLRLAAHSLDGLAALVSRAAQLPYAHWTLAEVAGPAWLFVLLPLAWVVLPAGWPGRKVAVIGVVALVAWRPPSPPADCFDTWVLDAGQGLATVLETHDGVTVYDTGMAWRGGGSVAQQVVIPFLESRGIAKIERLVVSHGDLDHSGGIDDMRERFAIRHVIVGEYLPRLPGWRCDAGKAWWSGAVRFEVLHPPAADRPQGNDASCVLRVSAGPYALLLTGDIEAAAERSLVQHGAVLGADVVIVPHHGSRTSSSAPFVDSVQPAIAIVSAGYANRWGFPKPRVVERWQGSGAAVLSTADAGAVFFRLCATGGVVELRQEREQRRRFWHAGT